MSEKGTRRGGHYPILHGLTCEGDAIKWKRRCRAYEALLLKVIADTPHGSVRAWLEEEMEQIVVDTGGGD